MDALSFSSLDEEHQLNMVIDISFNENDICDLLNYWLSK